MSRSAFPSLFLSLLALWLALNASLAGDVVLIGVIAAAAIAWWFRGHVSIFSEFRLSLPALAASLGYFAHFMRELVRSNLRLAGIVLSPALPLKPGIVKVRTQLTSRMGRLMLANSISLTPGTLSVELADEWLYVHWVAIETDAVEEATKRIVAGFERYLKVMYG